PCDAALVLARGCAVHHRLSHAISRISRHASPRAVRLDLWAAAPLSRALARRDGGDRQRARRARRARLWQSRAVEPRRRYRAFRPEPARGYARDEAADLSLGRPGRP